MKGSARLRLLGSLIIASANFCAAQNIQTPISSSGQSPDAVYDESNVDGPNVINGNLNLGIPLVSFPQRGHQLHLAFRIFYNDQRWFVSNFCNGYNSNTQTFSNPCSTAMAPNQWTWTQYPGTTPWPTNMGVFVSDDIHLDFGQDESDSSYSGNNEGGGSGYQQYTITAMNKSSFVAGVDGAKHYVADYPNYQSSGISGSPSIPYIPTNVYPSNDGTGYVATASSSYLDKDGNSYTPASITDPAGNTITLGNGWVDSIGRRIPGNSTGPGTGSTTQASGGTLTTGPIPGIAMSSVAASCPSGTSQSRQWIIPSAVAASETYYLCYSSVSYSTNFNPAVAAQNLGITTYEASGSTTVLTAIILPNAQSYKFAYDAYLSLSTLTLPTGATITYTWQTIPDYFFVGVPLDVTPVKRALASRTINPGNGMSSRTWHYGWIQSGSTVYAIMTDPLGNDTERALSGLYATTMTNYTGCSPHDTGSYCSGTGSALKSESYTYRSIGGASAHMVPSYRVSPPEEPYMTDTSLVTSAGTMVRRTVNTFAPAFVPSTGSCEITQYPPPGTFANPYQVQTNQQSCYDANAIIQTDEYDWGAGQPGALIKTTLIRYEWQNDLNTGTKFCTNSGQTGYLAANLVNLKQCVKVTTGGISGTVLSETDYGYDESGNPQGAFGNLTSTTQINFQTGTPSVSRTIYNSQGMPTKKTDPRGNSTNIYYDSTGMFPTQVTLPSSTSYGGTAVTHNDYYAFDSNTGHMTSHTDQNGQITTYGYTDPALGAADVFGRLHQVTDPQTVDGTAGGSGTLASGYTTYTYNDTPGSLSVTQQTLQTSAGQLLTQVTDFDELGEVITSTDAAGATINKTYDAGGRLYSVSNPHFSSGSSTDDTTYYTYDALGRMIQRTNPDSTSRTYAYSGNTVTETDESQHAWTRTSDGLGRLVSVVEPGSLATSYTYDALNNLKSVNQLGNGSTDTHRTRSFTYDSLSRLITSQNPETGTICYGTTGNAPPTTANCVESYDLNGNLTAKTDARGVTVSYSYDQLNRLVSKISSGINYTYAFDLDPVLNPSNPKGRLVWETNNANAERHYSYDAIGRTLLEEGSSPITSGSTANPVSASYDLAGNMTSLTYPDGRVATQVFDAANRLSTVSASNGTSTPSTYLSAISYGAPGQLLSATMGNGVSLSQAFDTRLRQTSKSYGEQVVSCGKYGCAIPSYENVWAKTYSWSPSGNLILTTDTVQGQARQFTYDSLNRLTTVQDIVPNATSGGETRSTSDGSQDNALATPQSIDGSIWGMSNATIVQNNAVAPDGSMTALTMTANAGSTNSTIDAVSPTPALFDGATATGKVWLKVPSGTLTTSMWVIDANSGFAGTGQTVTLNTTWQQFTISNVALKNGLVTLALQIGSNNTITGGQVVNVWGPELTISGSPDTNILPSSQQVGAAGWGVANGTVQSNALTAPDGSMTAATIVPASGSTDTYLADNVANPAQFSSTTVTGSVYLSASSGTPTIDIYVGSAGPSGGIAYTTLPVSLSSTWQRFAITQTTQASLSQLFLQIGGGGLLKAGQTINVWGAQMVVGSSDGNYIATKDTTTSPSGATEYLAANGLNESYTYDSFGNLQQTGNLTFEQSYTATNQLSGWSYDAAGDLLSDQLSNTYTYDANGMISSDGSTAYYYDASGNRAGKSGSTPTDTIYFGGKPVARYSGGVWTDLIYGDSGILAEVSGALSAAPTYRMTDHLGTSVGTLSSTGVLSGLTDYAPFGQVFSGGDTDPYKFTGKERDAESGMDYFGARYYNSNMGRMLSPDWSAKVEPVPYAKLDNPQSLNLYAYVGNNPMSEIDADGHSWLDRYLQQNSASAELDQANAAASANMQQQALKSAQAQQQSPQPGTPVNSQYGLVVENDSGGHTNEVNRDSLGRRIIEYDFRLQPVDAKHPLGGDPGNVSDVVISEHLSNPSVFGGPKYPEKGGQFTDGIGAGLTGSGSTDRYFTVTRGGKSLGVVPIFDRNGPHLVDHITMTSNPRTVVLNGTLNRTDIP